MSLTVQCRLLCKTLKAVDIFCIPYFNTELCGLRQSCPLEPVCSVETEGWLGTVPRGETTADWNIDLLCQAVVNRFGFSFCCGPEDKFESSSNLHEQFYKD